METAQTLKQTIHVIARPADWEEKGYYLLARCTDGPPVGEDEKIAVVATMEVEIPVPAFNITEIGLSVLEKERDALAVKHASAMARIDDKIQQLRALPAPVEA